MTCYIIITLWFLQFYGMYCMYYYFPQMLEYQDIQSIHFLTRGVLLYTNFKCCTPSTVFCLITCKMWAKIRNEAVSDLNDYSWAAGFPSIYPDSPWCRYADTKRGKRAAASRMPDILPRLLPERGVQKTK